MIPSEINSERVTRKRLIDPKLRAAGWKIVPFSAQKTFISNGPCAIEEFDTANGPADYALCVEGRIVGIVEAKKLTLGPQGVLMQAERYCKGIVDSPFNYQGFRVSFLYSTNARLSSITTLGMNCHGHAILSKAFRGELVPTEAEVARREGRYYEPASVLLERIKNERATASTQLKGRRFARKGKAVSLS